MKLKSNKLNSDVKVYASLYGINLVLLFIAYYMLFWRTITNDAVTVYAARGTIVHFTWENVLECVAGGRWLAGIINFVLAVFKYDLLENQWIMQLLKELICAYIPIRLVGLFRKKEWSFQTLLGVDLLLLMCTLNVYIEEMFAYNSLEIGIGWLLAVEAAVLFTRDKYVSAGVVTFLSLGIYQVNFSIVVIIGLTWLLYNNGIVYSKDIFKKCLYLLMVITIPAALTIAIPSIAMRAGWTGIVVKETVLEGSVDWKQNVVRICGFIFAFLFTSAQGMMPYGMIIVYLLVIYGVYFIEMRKQQKDIKTIVLTMIYVTLLFAVCYVIGIIQSIVSLPPRVAFGVFFAIPMLVFLVYQYTKSSNRKKLIIVGTVIFEITLFACTFFSGVDHRISNQLDIDYATQVQNEIDAYEETEGCTVEEIYFYYCKEDNTKTAYSDYMLHHYFVQSYNNSIFTTAWGAPAMIEWLADRDYKAQEMTPEYYAEVFGSEPWESLDLNKQIKFEGNQMYWAIYLD